MAYWMVVGSPENFGIAHGRGFDIFGFKSSRRREASQMKPGDKLVFYLTGVMKLAGIAAVQSPYFEDHTPVWRSAKKAGEDFPFRAAGAGAPLGGQRHRPFLMTPCATLRALLSF